MAMKQRIMIEKAQNGFIVDLYENSADGPERFVAEKAADLIPIVSALVRKPMLLDPPEADAPDILECPECGDANLSNRSYQAWSCNECEHKW